MRTRFLIAALVILAFVLASAAMPNLSKVYDSCEMTQDNILQPSMGHQWTNGLLYIDNAGCTWKLFGVISITSILDDNKTTTHQ